ncbi:MAG TPA: MFS transporter [Pseudonocardiaceae bacterium]
MPAPSTEGQGAAGPLPGTDPRRWRILAVTLAAGFMGLLDVSIVNVALPSIQRGVGASAGAVQWVVSGYALTFGLALVAGGRLGDVLGRRRMFLIALVGFTAASALVGAAPNVTVLVLARLLQGLVAGLLTPQNTGLIQDLFRGAERGRAFGLFGATVGISTAVGPVIGGVILWAFGESHGWRWVFLVNVPIGVVVVILAARLLPVGHRRPGRLRSEIDFVGAVVLGLAVLCVLLPLVRAESGGLLTLWWLFPLAVLLGVVLLRWERHVVRRGRAPLLDPRLFTGTPGFVPGAVLGAVYFCGFTGVWLVLSVFLQIGLGYSPLVAGLAVTPFALASAASSAVAGRLVFRWGRRVTVTGLLLMLTGMLGVAFAVLLAAPGATGWAIALPLFVAGAGGGAVISPNTTLTLECVPTRMAGVAGAVLQTGQRIGTAVGTALLAGVFHATLVGTGDYPLSATTAVLVAVGLITIALVIALLELRTRRARGRAARTVRETVTPPLGPRPSGSG